MARPTEPYAGQAGLNDIEAGWGHGPRYENKTKFLFRIPYFLGNAHTTSAATGTTATYMTSSETHYVIGSADSSTAVLAGAYHPYIKMEPTNFRAIFEGGTSYALVANLYKGTTSVGSISTSVTGAASSTWRYDEADVTSGTEYASTDTWSIKISGCTTIRNLWFEVEGYCWQY